MYFIVKVINSFQSIAIIIQYTRVIIIISQFIVISKINWKIKATNNGGRDQFSWQTKAEEPYMDPKVPGYQDVQRVFVDGSNASQSF